MQVFYAGRFVLLGYKSNLPFDAGDYFVNTVFKLSVLI